jgi:hypothetical protein
MLEVLMSVWPTSGVATGASLNSSEGALISVSVAVEARLLEDLLEALAQLRFPINPQIYHDAAIRYLYADGRESIVPTTLVEFPAYAGRLPEIRQMMEAYGFPSDAVHVAFMLEELHAEPQPEPAEPGKSYVSRVRIKHAHAGVA